MIFRNAISAVRTLLEMLRYARSTSARLTLDGSRAYSMKMTPDDIERIRGLCVDVSDTVEMVCEDVGIDPVLAFAALLVAQAGIYEDARAALEETIRVSKVMVIDTQEGSEKTH